MLHKHCFSPTVAHCQALIVIGWQDSKQQKWAEEQTSDRPQCHEEKTLHTPVLSSFPPFLATSIFLPHSAFFLPEPSTH